MSDARIVLFGGSGFVGSNLREHIAVPMLVPDETEADLTQPETLKRIIQPGDRVINAAGYANATDTTEKGRALFHAINVDGVRNLAQAAVDRQAAQLVRISSVAAMGRWHQENVTEDMLKPVTTPYAASERVLREFRQETVWQATYEEYLHLMERFGIPLPSTASGCEELYQEIAR